MARKKNPLFGRKKKKEYAQPYAPSMGATMLGWEVVEQEGDGLSGHTYFEKGPHLLMVFYNHSSRGFQYEIWATLGEGLEGIADLDLGKFDQPITHEQYKQVMRWANEQVDGGGDPYRGNPKSKKKGYTPAAGTKVLGWKVAARTKAPRQSVTTLQKGDAHLVVHHQHAEGGKYPFTAKLYFGEGDPREFVASHDFGEFKTPMTQARLKRAIRWAEKQDIGVHVTQDEWDTLEAYARVKKQGGAMEDHLKVLEVERMLQENPSDEFEEIFNELGLTRQTQHYLGGWTSHTHPDRGSVLLVLRGEQPEDPIQYYMAIDCSYRHTVAEIHDEDHRLVGFKVFDELGDKGIAAAVKWANKHLDRFDPVEMNPKRKRRRKKNPLHVDAPNLEGRTLAPGSRTWHVKKVKDGDISSVGLASDDGWISIILQKEDGSFRFSAANDKKGPDEPWYGRELRAYAFNAFGNADNLFHSVPEALGVDAVETILRHVDKLIDNLAEGDEADLEAELEKVSEARPLEWDEGRPHTMWEHGPEYRDPYEHLKPKELREGPIPEVPAIFDDPEERLAFAEAVIEAYELDPRGFPVTEETKERWARAKDPEFDVFPGKKRHYNPGRPIPVKTMLLCSQGLWEAYDAKPTKKNLMQFGKWLGIMSHSKSARVKQERRRGLRAFRKEMRDQGWRMPKKDPTRG
jgi:hypothetical protein